MRGLVTRKYYWETLFYDIEVYVRGCDICLAFKTVRHKPYGNLQQLLVSTHYWKNLSMSFVTGLPQFADWWGNSYDLILVIIILLTKMVQYEPVQTTITVSMLVDVIFNIVIWYHGLPDSIVSDPGSVFTTKFCSSLCYFLSIKRRLSTAFHP